MRRDVRGECRRTAVPLLALLLATLGAASGGGAPTKGGATETEMFLMSLTDPMAVCNDGSQGGYYIANATDPAKSHLYLLYLEGGQWCYDAASCATRSQSEPFLVGSAKWPPHQHMGGIFDSDPKRNPWAGANLFYLGYCSSDAWIGDVAATDIPWGWAFRGQRIVAAMLTEMATKYGMGTAPGHRLLLSGCSAGARGAMFTLDYVAGMVPAGVQVRGFLDSPLWVDELPLSASIMPLQNETQAIYKLVNPTARLGTACAAAYPGPLGWKCLYGQYRIPYLETPYLLSASQFDKYQLPYNEGGMPPYAPGTPQFAFADGFQSLVRFVVLNVPTAAQVGSAVFSSACFKHCTSNMGAFWGVRIDDVSLKDYLQAWYFGTPPSGGAGLPSGVPPQRIEACIGFGCGQCHSKTATPAPPLPPSFTTVLGVGAVVAPPPRRLRLGPVGAAGVDAFGRGGVQSGSGVSGFRVSAHVALLGALAAATLCCAACVRGAAAGDAPRGAPPSRGGPSYFEMPQRKETEPLLGPEPPLPQPQRSRRPGLHPPAPPAPPRGATRPMRTSRLDEGE